MGRHLLAGAHLRLPDERAHLDVHLLPGPGIEPALIFVVGFFLDFVEISVIILPIVTPALILLGLDPIWLAVLIAINLQTSFLTPPFGFSLFYLRGAAPPEITTIDIYRGVAPDIGLQIIGLVLVWSLPAIATTLPRALFN